MRHTINFHSIYIYISHLFVPILEAVLVSSGDTLWYRSIFWCLCSIIYL